MSKHLCLKNKNLINPSFCFIYYLLEDFYVFILESQLFFYLKFKNNFSFILLLLFVLWIIFLFSASSLAVFYYFFVLFSLFVWIDCLLCLAINWISRTYFFISFKIYPSSLNFLYIIKNFCFSASNLHLFSLFSFFVESIFLFFIFVIYILKRSNFN